MTHLSRRWQGPENPSRLRWRIGRSQRAFIYDWNLLPIGQPLWLKELETYKEFPSLQTRPVTTWTRS